MMPCTSQGICKLRGPEHVLAGWSAYQVLSHLPGVILSRMSGGAEAFGLLYSLSMNPSEAAASPLVGKRLMHDRYSCACKVDPSRSRICMIWSFLF
jgi:hypothetical protein